MSNKPPTRRKSEKAVPASSGAAAGLDTPSVAERVVEALRAGIRDAEGRGLTRYAMAKASGVSQGQFSHLMSGERLPRLDTAAAIAWAAGFELKLVKRRK